MTRTIHEIIGLPSSVPRFVLKSAVEARMDADFAKAESGDTSAQCELAELRFAYLLWAYGQKDEGAPAPTRSGRVFSAARNRARAVRARLNGFPLLIARPPSIFF